MASIKFSVRGKRNPSKITARLILDKDTDYRITTPIFINPIYFNNKSGKIRQIAEFTDKQNMQDQLDTLQRYLIDKVNFAIREGEYINSDWLKECLDSHFNVIVKTDYNLLINYCDHYVDKLKLKTNEKTGELGASRATITKYNTIKTKLEAFQKFKRKTYRLVDVNLKFRNDFLEYLLEVDKLARNTAGRYIKFLKTICLDAQRSGFKVNQELASIKGFKVEVKKIYLNFEEIEKIISKKFDDEKLKSARDWLVIGCYIGQRVGDLLSLTKYNIRKLNGRKFIELTQQKTKKKVTILIHPKVQTILDQNNGEFPTLYSNNLSSSMAVFNLLIKDVCFYAGLTEVIEGARIDKATNRKEEGEFQKFKLITSHICRRSFATNHYGDIPTPYLLNITGHSTEREFLNYIGKTSIDYADQMASYWEKQIEKERTN